MLNHNSVLEIENLSFSYTQNALKKDVLKSLCARFYGGEICWILAANGSGKTTLFRLILGFLNAQNGTITLNQSYQPNQPSQLNKAHQVRQSCQNIALHAMSAHKRSSYISYMPQFIETPFDYKVLDMVLMGLHFGYFDMPNQTMKNKALKILDELGVGDLAEESITKLSGGQKQMVFLAQILIKQSPIILLDEPSSHLDIKNKLMLFDMIAYQTKKHNLITLVNIHDIELIKHYGDRIYMLKNAEVYKSGDTSILSDDIVREFFELESRFYANTRERKEILYF